jgi:hypothetical protein
LLNPRAVRIEQYQYTNVPEKSKIFRSYSDPVASVIRINKLWVNPELSHLFIGVPFTLKEEGLIP